MKAEAHDDPELLERVVLHKQEFYPAAWASYETARKGEPRLSPRAERVEALSQDYRDTGVMIFGDPPSFEDALAELRQLEEELNKK